MTDITNPTLDKVEEDIESPVDVADKPREPTTYERKLRAEAASYRKRLSEQQTASEAAIAFVKTEAEARITELNNQSRQRLIRAELKAHAIKSGLVDLDTLKLFDLSKVEIDESGEVSNAEAIIEGFKKSKPHFFGVATTSSTATAPKPSPPSTKVALDMSDDEFKAARRRIDAGGQI